MRIILVLLGVFLASEAQAQTVCPPTAVVLNSIPYGRGPGNSSFNCMVPAANSILTTNGSNVPSFTQTLPPILGTVTITPPALSTVQGFAITQTGPSSGSNAGPLAYNSIAITDQSNVTGAVNSDQAQGLSVTMTTGGSNSDGTKTAIIAILNHTIASNAGTARDNVALTSRATSSASEGGTGTGAGTSKGTLFSDSCASVLASGATNYFSVSCSEDDIGILTGASAYARFGRSLVSFGNVQAASQYDAALEVAASGLSWKLGLMVSSSLHGTQGVDITGTLIGTDGIPATVANGVDFSAYTFSGSVFKGPSGFAVSGIADITGKSITLTSNTNNPGVTVTDGAAIGVMRPDASFTHSILIGTTSNHTLGFLTNNTITAALQGTIFYAGTTGGAGSVNLQGSLGCIGELGTTSGTATICAQPIAGTPTLLIGTGSGTIVATASSPLAISATTGNITCATCLAGAAAALTKTDDTNVTLTLGGTPTTALLQATSITVGWSGQLSIARGGTGQATAAAAFNALSPMNTLGDIIYGGASSGAGTRLAGNTTTTRKFLRQTGDGLNSAAPVWDTVTAADLALANTHILVGNGSNIAVDVAMSGDATLANTGAVTLASVASAGTTGSSTAIPVITINAKGITTSITTVAVIASAGTLSGATLAAGVTASSLTSLGTITSLTATTINAFTLGGTVSGGGNQINNVIIGTTSPLRIFAAGASFDPSANVLSALTFSGAFGGGICNSDTAFACQWVTNSGTIIHWKTGGTSGGFGGANGDLQLSTTGLTIVTQQFMPNITTTSAAQTGTVCWTTGTGKFTVDTTVGCLTSIEEAKIILNNLSPQLALNIVQQLKPFSFRYKEGYGDGGRYEQFGLGAHQVASIDERMAGRDPMGSLQGVRYQELTAVLSGAIQQLKSDNDNLRAMNDNLATRVQELEAKVR